MNHLRRCVLAIVATLAVLFSMAFVVAAQERAVVLTGADLARVVPPGFYFQGRTAPTQTRNAAAARFGKDRYVISGMVDTSGYAADVRATYEGFLITDSAISINGSDLGVGAYGFGFSKDGKLNILDLAGPNACSSVLHLATGGVSFSECFTDSGERSTGKSDSHSSTNGKVL